jgi:hypothetical protein
VRNRPALLLVCALLAAPSAALYAADAPRPVRPPTGIRKPLNDSIILDLGGWLLERARDLANPFGATSTPASPAPAPSPRLPLACDRSQCPIG